MKIDTYLPIIDTLINQLEKGFRSYKFLNNLDFFSNLKFLEINELYIHCKKLAEFYHLNINENNLVSKCIRFKEFLLGIDTYNLTIPELYSRIKKDKIKGAFSNIEKS